MDTCRQAVRVTCFGYGAATAGRDPPEGPKGRIRPVPVIRVQPINVRFWGPITQSDTVSSGPRHQGCQAREEAEWLEPELGGAVAKRPLKPVHNQTIASRPRRSLLGHDGTGGARR